MEEHHDNFEMPRETRPALLSGTLLQDTSTKWHRAPTVLLTLHGKSAEQEQGFHHFMELKCEWDRKRWAAITVLEY